LGEGDEFNSWVGATCESTWGLWMGQRTLETLLLVWNLGKSNMKIVMGYVSYPNPFLGYWKAQYIFIIYPPIHTYSMMVGRSK